ncbi:hypothetical protein LUZ63_005630 [Rhynchospora breviuscula]|uniref:Uncharacterized protein n=1 Tax=Rhynchospora breviuscula TaxID=2022672 RepID=A0A9Q0CN83_9POAL|nr:hypothetical protein LUZ63_005630 [Rhynchospora breviuscula]
MDKRPKESTNERLLGPRASSPSESPSLPPISFSSDATSTKRRQWSSGPPNQNSMRYRTGRLSSPIPPPSPSASSTASTKDNFTDRSFDDTHSVGVTQPQLDVHLNPIWPDTVINLIKRSTLDPHHGDPSTIRRVPREFRTGIDDLCSPKVVCLGPYFHSYRHSPSLKYMQDNKWRCVQSLISRYDGLSEPDKTPILIQRCTILMKAVDAQLRQAYSDSISLDNEELAEMMVLDGCFLLHLLLRHAPSGMMKEENLKELEQGQNHTSISSNRPWVWDMVIYDLLLVENQIPFFVVEILFDVFKTKHDGKIDLLACMLNLFTEIQPHATLDVSLFRNRRYCIHHFLHAYYLSLLPQVNQREYSSSLSPPLLSPTESTVGLSKLLEEGIRIKNNKKSTSFMDISFKNGVMAIPTLQIHDYSIRLFHNIMAYEQCEHDNTGYVSSYMAFMQGVIDDSNDMKTMNSNGIIVDRRSTDQSENTFFGNFGDLISISSEESYLRGLYWELSRYGSVSRNGNRWTSCMQQHLSSPAVVFSMGALVMFLLVRNRLDQ